MVPGARNSPNIKMTEDINKIKSIRAAYKGQCTQNFKKGQELITSKSSDHAELEALVNRLASRAKERAQMDAKIAMSLETEGLFFPLSFLYKTNRFQQVAAST